MYLKNLEKCLDPKVEAMKEEIREYIKGLEYDPKDHCGYGDPGLLSKEELAKFKSF